VAIFRDQVTQPAYGLLNGRVSYNMPDSGLEIAAFVKNATAKKYYVATGTFDNSLGYDIMFVGSPRTYGVQLIKRFGGG
jgi:iron complex outermembrane receptor protein